MKCMYCKNKIDDDSNFCIFCGKAVSIDAIAKINMQNLLQSAKKMNIDLLEVSAHEGSCKYCSQFQGKVFSISGKSRKYPKLPDYVLENGNFHKGCRHTFFKFYDGISIPTRTKEELEELNKTAI